MINNKPADSPAPSPEGPLDRWRPIETAPKDGKNVLLWWPKQFHCALTGHWADKWSPWIGWKVSGWSHDKFETLPTHWMPLPQPPSLDAATGAPVEAAPNLEDDGMYSVGGFVADIEALEASRAERYAVFGPGMSGRTNDLAEAETWLRNNPAALLYELSQTKEPKP